MTPNDPFAFDDAAYVLGALSPEDQDAFEEHLLTCDACLARVREIRDVPDLLAGLAPSDVADLPAAAEQLPDTLLPGLLRRAAGQRRRRGWLVGSLASVAAACLVALTVVLWPAGSPSGDRPVATARSFTPVTSSPVQATAALTAKAWGTGIDLHCHYLPGATSSWSYDLVVYGRDGSRQDVGSWKLPPEKDITFPAGTSLAPSEISRLEITLPDGTPILRLNT